MNTSEENNENNEHPEHDAAGGALPTDRRPLGYWLKVVDGLITHEFHTAFDAEELTRRDWMVLNVLSGAVDAPGLAERLQRKGKTLRRLAERGWLLETDGTWTLTDEGRAVQERLGAVVGDIRSRIAGAVSAEDFAITMTSLEAIARELGWDETHRMPRHGRGFGHEGGHRGRHGFGHGFAPGFGRGFAPEGHDQEGEHAHGRRHHGRPDGSDFGRGFGPEAHRHGAPAGCGHPGARHHRGEREGGHGRHGERAYERGFDAGFSRGRAEGTGAAGASDAA